MKSLSLIFLLICLNFFHPSLPQTLINSFPSPPPFTFGVATAAYQIEGAWDEGGRGPSVWDTFTHRVPSPILDKSTGDVAADSFHNLPRDLSLLDHLGVHAYRFSISWSRVLPIGDSSQVNEEGIFYYETLIDSLEKRKIFPFVTLFHWDLPEELQKIGGWTNKLLVDHFVDYARLMFLRFGDKVKKWITFNEPNEFCGNGYGGDTAAPGLNLKGVGDYLCMHNVILAHAKVYKMFREEFKAQNGEIGITLNNRFVFADKEEDEELINRFMAFTLGWKMDPLFKRPFQGYPEDMKREISINSRNENRTKSRLPEFQDEDLQLFQGKCADFLGLNYYTSRIVSQAFYSRDSAASYEKDLNLTMKTNANWIRAKSPWLYSVPEGLHQLLVWIKEKYNGPRIYVTENGWSDDGDLIDTDRINYLKDHLKAIRSAIEEGVDVQGYFHWSLMDNFEWERGYTEKFGLFQINFTDPRRGYQVKQSAQVFKDIVAGGLDSVY